MKAVEILEIRRCFFSLLLVTISFSLSVFSCCNILLYLHLTLIVNTCLSHLWLPPQLENRRVERLLRYLRWGLSGAHGGVHLP